MNRLSHLPVEQFNPILHRGQGERTARRWSVERVAAGALPLLTSISALQPAANILSSAFIGRAKVLNLREALQQQERSVVLKKAADLVCFLGVLITTLLSRRIGGSLSLLVQALQAVCQLLQALWSLDRVQIQAALLPVLSASIQVASLMSGGALLWMVAAGLMQVSGDLVSAWHEGRTGGLYEASMLLLAALLRALSIAGPCQQLAEDLTSKQATAEDVQKIIDQVKQEMASRLTTATENVLNPSQLGVSQLKSSPPLRIDEQLRLQGFSRHLRRLDLSYRNLQKISFEGIRFDQCDLEGAQLDHSQLRRLEFHSCNLRGASFQEAHLDEVHFTHSDLQQASFERSQIRITAFRASRLAHANFAQAQLERVAFKNNLMESSNFGRARLHQVEWKESDLTEVNFSQAQMDQVDLESCDLSHSLLNHARLHRVVLRSTQLHQSCLLGAEVKRSTLDRCRGQDTLFCGTETQWTQHQCQFEKSDRPIIALGWNPESPLNFGSLCYESLKDQGAVVLRYDFRGADIQSAELAQEVSQGLERWDQGSAPTGSMSRGQSLVQQPTGLQTARLVEQAQRVLAFSDALLLPGGMDIEPELYGQQRADVTHTEDSWNRSILEMALLESARQQKAPVLAICRGMQMINVFHGGTLHQDARPFIGDMHEIQLCPLEPTGPEASTLSTQLQAVGLDAPAFYGYSCHHQAVDQLAPHCRAVAQGEGLVKALLSRDGQYVGTQFHPEIYLRADTQELLDIQQFVSSPKLDEEAAVYLHEYLGREVPNAGSLNEAQRLDALRTSLLAATQEYLESVRIWKSIFSCHVERAVAARRMRAERASRQVTPLSASA